MRAALKKKRILNILMGFLLASTGYLFMEYQYEKKTLNAVISTVYKTPGLDANNDEAVALAAMQVTHDMMKTKGGSMGLELNGVEKAITSPLQQFALTKDGACGGNTLVLAQVLSGMGYKVRPVQMLVKGVYGGHIILEAKVNNKWAALDPMFNLSFRGADGQLASFDEVGENWQQYKAQLPAGYNPDYAFTGKQYTNWAKLPVAGTLLKGTLNLFMGRKAASEFSLRSLFLNPKKVLFFSSLFLLGLSFIAMLNKKYFKISVVKLFHLPRLRPQGKFKPALNG
jgi:hypothetical protein